MSSVCKEHVTQELDINQFFTKSNKQVSGLSVYPVSGIVPTAYTCHNLHTLSLFYEEETNTPSLPKATRLVRDSL